MQKDAPKRDKLSTFRTSMYQASASRLCSGEPRMNGCWHP